MPSASDIFIPGTGPLYRVDARVKLVLLVVFSVAVFFVEAWAGLGLLLLFLLVAALLGRLPLGRLASMAVPVLTLLLFIVACNSLVNCENGTGLAAFAGVSAGFAEGMAPLPLFGQMAFSPEGCMRGLFYLSRIVLVVWASFVLVFSTRATQLTDALTSLLSPLRFVRFPVKDAAMVCSLVLRFIPLAGESYESIRRAQVSRAATYDAGDLWSKVRAYATLFVPLIVTLFRQADRLADAMDARCYGKGERTQLNPVSLGASDVVVLVCGCTSLIALAWMF